MTNRISVSMFCVAVAAVSLSFGQSVPPDTLITLQRGACEDHCAVYRLVIFADGTVLYQGRYEVKKTGLVKSGIAAEALAGLIHKLETGRFFDFAHQYGFGDSTHCQALIAGEPNAILSVSSGGRSKTVLHQHGCKSAESDHLTALEYLVDQAAGSARWIK